MKSLLMFLLTVSLAACSIPPSAAAQTSSDTTPVPIPTGSVPTAMTPEDAAEEAAVRALVESFGKSLQRVSLLAPNVTQQLEKQYSEFVSPPLKMWMSDVSKAPGRTVSSPWPDQIEITALEKESADRYIVSGFVVEVSSREVVNGGAAAKIPAQIVIQKDQGGWLITDYKEEQ